MAGNKHDNGVHEQGTDETRMAYQEDTPGQSVQQYIEDRNKAYHEEAVEKKKKHFSQVFQNPLKGFPYNEEIEVKEIKEGKKIQDIARKHKRELQKIQKSGNLELSKKAEDELYQWASNSGEIHGDEEDEFWDWIDSNLDDLVKGKIKEGKELEERHADVMRKRNQSQQKAHQKAMMKSAKKSIKDYDARNKNKNEEIEENADASLKKKSEKSGISVGILKQVYNRGVAAWKTGHRPGTTPEQWGHARVNSFITKGSGTWGKADADLAKQVRGESKPFIKLQ